MRRWIAAFALCLIGAAHAQQPAAPQRTTDQQARSYIMSAFMTGSAPMILSPDVIIAPELRQRLGLPADADTRKMYEALASQTVGRPLSVRRASADESAKAALQPDPTHPLFNLDTGQASFLVQYDLERDSITHVAQLSAPEAPKQAETPAPAPTTAAPATTEPAPVVTAPLAEPAAAAAPEATQAAKPASAPEPAPTQAAAPAAAPVAPEAVAPAAAAAPAAPVYGTAEPQLPRTSGKAASAAPAAKAAAAPTRTVAVQERPPLPKPNGACVIKPVMSDQDLVNCGATPHYQ